VKSDSSPSDRLISRERLEYGQRPSGAGPCLGASCGYSLPGFSDPVDRLAEGAVKLSVSHGKKATQECGYAIVGGMNSAAREDGNFKPSGARNASFWKTTPLYEHPDVRPFSSNGDYRHIIRVFECTSKFCDYVA